MDFMSRGRTPEAPQGQAPVPAQHMGGRRKHFDWNNRVVRIEWFIFALVIAVLLLITIGWAIWNGSNVGYSEANHR